MTEASKSIFDSEDEEEVLGTDATFGHNKGYAERFERRKSKQELARLQALHGDDEDSEDAESEDEDAEMLTPDLDLQILKTIDKIRNKDSGLYQPDRKWFDATRADDVEAEGQQEAGQDGSAPPKKAAAEKKVTIRTQLLEQGATAFASDDDDDDDDVSGRRGAPGERASKAKLAYDPEQEKLRRAFKGEGDDGEAGDDDDDDDDDDGLLAKKAKPAGANDEDDVEYREWLQRKLDREAAKGKGGGGGGGGAEPVDESVSLRRYMFGDGSQLSGDEKFLRDYVVNAMWKRRGEDDDDEGAGGGRGRGGGGSRSGGVGGEGDSDGDDDNVVGGGEGDEEEEEFSDRADDFERGHNFRFEEAGATQVQGHARHDPKSMRRQSKLARKGEKTDEKKARKLELRKQKEAELKRLKNLKKGEILDRLRTIEKVSGGASNALSEVDLTGEFDPDAFDARMAQLYGDDYYAQPDEGFRNKAADDAALGGGVPAELLQREAAQSSAEGGGGGYGDGDGDGDGDGGGGTGGGGGGGAGGSGGGGGGGGFEALTRQLQQSKDKKVRRTAQQYMDEYYALDFEDLLGGDLPTRFKYRQVDASGFGVTDEDLLKLSDKELNVRVPLRYVKSAYGDHDEQRLKKRQKRMHWEKEQEARAQSFAAERAVAATKKAKKAKVAKAAAAEDGGAGGDAPAAPKPPKQPKQPKQPSAHKKPAAAASTSHAAAAPAGLSKKAQKAGISEDRANAFAHLKQKGGIKKREKKEVKASKGF